MAADLDREAMTMVARDRSAHPWSMLQEEPKDIFRINLTIPSEVQAHANLHGKRDAHWWPKARAVERYGLQERVARIREAQAAPLAEREVLHIDRLKKF